MWMAALLRGAVTMPATCPALASSTAPLTNSTAPRPAVAESRPGATSPRGSPGWRMLSTPGSQRRSEEHTSELQSRENLVCRLLLEKKNDGMYNQLLAASSMPTEEG